ncbi:MAG: ATP-binding protein [Deltaproteobacteria bacterium]|nr:ATP-binding protein [Deltaproteobacteria bacterium]
MTKFISRTVSPAEFLVPGKALIIYGPRRSGKTTLLKSYLASCGLRYRLETGDDVRIRHLLGSGELKQIAAFAEGFDLVAIDEAQQIPDIGMGLKILVDHLPTLRIIATGSSSFDLAGAIGEPLTGRKRTLTLFPISQMELKQQFNSYDLRGRLEEYLVYGSYPEIVMTEDRKGKIELLEELAGSYLLKDVLALERIRSSRTLLDLLKLVAFQVGSEVSLNELATQVRLDVKTVGRYLDILEKAFVLIRVGGFSRNLRNEVTSKAKYYFLDNGVRNAVIGQYNLLDSRNDVGALWENFVVAERLKKRSYTGIYGTFHFWRTYDGKEIDYIEERDGGLFGFECKWQANQKIKPPLKWLESYPGATFELVTPDNYLDFVG